MKRIFLLALTTVYLLSCIGIAVNSFYCCGKLRAVSLSAKTTVFDDCRMPVKKSGCCRTSSHTFQVKDHHLSSSSLFTLAAPLVSILPDFTLPEPPALFPLSRMTVPPRQPPPDTGDKAIHLLYRNFRI